MVSAPLHRHTEAERQLASARGAKTSTMQGITTAMMNRYVIRHLWSEPRPPDRINPIAVRSLALGGERDLPGPRGQAGLVSVTRAEKAGRRQGSRPLNRPGLAWVGERSWTLHRSSRWGARPS